MRVGYFLRLAFWLVCVATVQTTVANHLSYASSYIPYRPYYPNGIAVNDGEYLTPSCSNGYHVKIGYVYRSFSRYSDTSGGRCYFRDYQSGFYNCDGQQSCSSTIACNNGGDSYCYVSGYYHYYFYKCYMYYACVLNSPSRSRTPSISKSKSITASISFSPSVTSTKSVTASQTPSQSASRSRQEVCDACGAWPCESWEALGTQTGQVEDVAVTCTDPCASSPCASSYSCSSDMSRAEYFCVCADEAGCTSATTQYGCLMSAEERVYESPLCSNHGFCVSSSGYSGGRKCYCSPGYAGHDCSDRFIACEKVSGHTCVYGTCNANGLCDCDEGAAGDRCELTTTEFQALQALQQGANAARAADEEQRVITLSTASLAVILVAAMTVVVVMVKYKRRVAAKHKAKLDKEEQVAAAAFEKGFHSATTTNVVAIHAPQADFMPPVYGTINALSMADFISPTTSMTQTHMAAPSTEARVVPEVLSHPGAVRQEESGPPEYNAPPSFDSDY